MIEMGQSRVSKTLVFLQSSFMLRDYTPTIDERYFYPVSPTLLEVTRHTGAEQTLWADNATIPVNSNLWYGLRHPGNYDAMGIHSYDMLYIRLIRSLSWFYPPDPTSFRALQVLGIQYVVTTRPYPFTSAVPGLQRIWTDGRFSVFRVPESLPRYFTVARGVAVGDDDEALRILERPDFDIAGSVLLHTTDRIETASGDYDACAAEIIEEDPTHIRLRVERDRPGWFVALLPFYPGWTATANGLRKELVRANVAFSATPVEAGVTEVVLEYDPLSVKLGVAISGATAATLLVAAVTLTFWAHRRNLTNGRLRDTHPLRRGHPGR